MLAVFVQGLSALLCLKSCSFVFSGCACRAVPCCAMRALGKEMKGNQPADRPSERASEHRRAFDLDREYTLNLLSGFIVTGAAFRNAIAIVSVSFVRASE